MSFSFHPFSDIPTAQWWALLHHPEVVRHMPLSDARWDEAAVAEWARGKDAQWEANAYGPHAIRIDGQFAGWGGFQQEGDEAEFALVLLPEFWGQGVRLFRHFMRGRAALGIGVVCVLLPPSRQRLRGLRRLGLARAGEVDCGGQRFLRFRSLDTR